MRASFAYREHLRHQRSSNEVWLYPDEYFVMDGWYYRYRPDYLPKTFEILVLHQGERLPFRYVEVTYDGGWPSMEEIESWESDKFTTSQPIHVESGIPENMTLVIPPWAFAEKAAYNVQLLFHPVWEPDEDRDMLRQRISSFYPHHHIYVGSELLLNDGGHIPRAEDYAEEIDAEDLDYSVGTNEGIFLAPPSDVYDWESIIFEDNRELGKVIDVPDEEITLEIHTTGVSTSFLSETDNIDTLYYVFQDNEVVDKFVLNPDHGMEFWTPIPGGKGYIVPTTIELPEDETTAIHVVSFADPFTRPIERNRHYGNGSNGLVLRHSPEEE